MKKTLAMLLTAALTFGFLVTGCNQNTPVEENKDPDTTDGSVDLINEYDSNGN